MIYSLTFYSHRILPAVVLSICHTADMNLTRLTHAPSRKRMKLCLSLLCLSRLTHAPDRSDMTNFKKVIKQRSSLRRHRIASYSYQYTKSLQRTHDQQMYSHSHCYNLLDEWERIYSVRFREILMTSTGFYYCLVRFLNDTKTKLICIQS